MRLVLNRKENTWDDLGFTRQRWSMWREMRKRKKVKSTKKTRQSWKDTQIWDPPHRLWSSKIKFSLQRYFNSDFRITMQYTGNTLLQRVNGQQDSCGRIQNTKQTESRAQVVRQCLWRCYSELQWLWKHQLKLLLIMIWVQLEIKTKVVLHFNNSVSNFTSCCACSFVWVQAHTLGSEDTSGVHSHLSPCFQQGLLRCCIWGG